MQLEDTKHFRQLHSKTPGHPENFITDGVEVTTGEDSSMGMLFSRENMVAIIKPETQGMWKVPCFRPC